MIPIVISGGSGTRLWPVSRAQYPKQFCHLFAEPLQAMTLKRCQQLGSPWILTSATLKTLTEKNLKNFGFDLDSVLYEPESRNTGPAIAVLCHVLNLLGKAQEVVGIFPSDALIRHENVFMQAVKLAERLAAQSLVITLGIKPRYPETGYGYIQAGGSLLKAGGLEAFSVQRFHEKPSFEKAEEFLRQGGFSWNAGIFVFKIDTMISHFKKHQPALWQTIETLKKDLSNISEVYKKLPSISLDYAIIEHLKEAELACVPSEMGWNDVGSWDAVAQEGGSAGAAEVVSEKSHNNFVYAQRRKLVALIGVEDFLVVDTEDSLLIAKKGQSQEVKKIVERLAQRQAPELKAHAFEERPWGCFEILRDHAQFKSKLIRIHPAAQISYQSHAQREEHWIVTEGQGEVILNDRVIPVNKGCYIFIPLGAKHRIRNTGSSELQFVEVQLGSYFGEDDIVRYQDDYSRV